MIKTKDAINDLNLDSVIAGNPDFVKFLPIEDGMKILDVGCLNGRDCLWIQKYFPNCEVYGVDIQEKCIEYCSQFPGIWKLADAQLLPFDDDEFDIAFANCVLCELETLEEESKMRLELKRVSKRAFICDIEEL